MKRYWFYQLLLMLSKILSNNITIGAPKARICISFAAKNWTIPTDMDDSDQEYDDKNDLNGFPSVITPTISSSFEAEKITCPADYSFCYALWQRHSNGSITIGQGCWKLSDTLGPCDQEQCISTYSTSTFRYCCCSGDLCNMNVTSIEQSEIAETVISNNNNVLEYKKLFPVWITPIFWFSFFLTVCLLIGALVFFKYRQPEKLGSEAAPLSPSGPGYSSNLQNVDNLKLCSMMGKGRYGTVWKGMINEQPVAVKIFLAHHKQYFINERNIYSLPHMDSPALLSYFGCDERKTMDGNDEYFLVLALQAQGCLQDWLPANTLPYDIFCRMAKSITRGLSHLHTEILQRGELKPCVCHRDLTSRNILVKNDLSCCLSDFGFALKTFGSKYEYKGEINVAETKSINEVGTLRYMAPEILEGAVNLRDCETALKQADVYSLGLILWELCVRCFDLYPTGQAPPPYKPPYAAEIGDNPTFEQMQVLVSRHKARPLFPVGWGAGAVGRIIKDTCEDCWDHDAEARLTSLCAEERIQELSNIKPRSHLNRGSSPPLSTINLIEGCVDSGKSSSRTFQKVFEIDSCLKTPPNQEVQVQELIRSKNSISAEKNLIVSSQQLQPFQGRNPCQERNLAPKTTRTQVLVEKSKKHSFVQQSNKYNLSCFEDDVSVEDLITSNRSELMDQIIIGEGFPKQNNTDKKLKGWHIVRTLIQKKLFRRDFGLNINDKSNLVESKKVIRACKNSPIKDINIKIIDNKSNMNTNNEKVQTKSEMINIRPTHLDITPITVKINGFSLENGIKSHPIDNLSYEKRNLYPRIVTSKSANAVKTLTNCSNDDKYLKRQRSLEVFREVFGSHNSTERLRNPNQRIKTPGDVPLSVRKARASKTLSLYDDRMMDTTSINSL